MPETFAAIDLGASSGRVVTGRLEGDRVALTEVHRFPNRPVRLPDGLRWNLLHLFTEALEGLRAAGPLRGVGVAAWGVDYALLDERGRVLGLPFHYRDARTAGMVERAFARVGAEEMYAATGIQVMPINTAFQLLADEPEGAARIALVPDLFAHWLGGEVANERTVASTTGLLDATTGEWARGVIAGLGLPDHIFGPLVDPGTPLGEHEGATVYAVAGHDTASAFAAAPGHDAILSSGTWSLLGLELGAPVLTEAAREANFSNERGVDGTTRLLKNVMGLWLEQECARVWGADHASLFEAAAAGPDDVPLFDPDDEAFLAPGDMPALIGAACEGQRAFRDRGELVRSIFVSLACKYRLVLEQLERVTGRDIRRIHVVGGGARVEPLCRLTADITGREVLVGPVEATALGNILVQMRASGAIGSLDVPTQPVLYEPAPDEATYARFLEILEEPAHV